MIPVSRRVMPFALAALAACLGGCVTVSGPTPDAAVPTAFSTPAAGGAQVGGTWWRAWRDPALDALVGRALAASPDLEAASARVRQARASRDQAAAGLSATLGSSASGNRGSTSLYQGGFQAGWEPDLSGGKAAAVAAGEAGTAAAAEALSGARLSLAADVARTYAEARGYQARAALARRSAASMRATATVVRGKVEAGAAPESDALKAEAQAESTAADVPVLEAAYRQSADRLGTLTGDGTGPALRALSRGAPVPPTPRRAGRLPADVVRARPDLRRLERLLAQSWAKVGVSEAALYPSVSMGGTLSLNAASLTGLGAAGAQGWGLGPSLDMPLLDGGYRKAAVAGAEAARDEAVANYRSGVATAMGEVEDALAQLAGERAALGSLARAAGAQRRAAMTARALYANGAGGFLDTLDAERSLYQAEVALIQGRVLLATYDAALCKALGGGSPPPTPGEGT